MGTWWEKLTTQRSLWMICSAAFVVRFVLVPWRLKSGWPNPFLLIPLLFLLFAVMLYFRHRWTKWAGIAAFLGVSALQFWVAILTQGLGRSEILFTLGVAAAIYGVWTMRDDEDVEASSGSGPEKPFLSLVLLLREPRYLDRSILASLASRAWNIELSAADHDDSAPDAEGDRESDSADAQPDNWIVGEPPLLVVRHQQATFIIHVFDRPYFDDVENVAEGCVDLRTRKAILDHTAWVAVDLLHWHEGEGDIGTAYRFIASLLAELADDNVVAVVDPAAGQAFPYDPEIEQKLHSEDPLSAFRDQSYAPVIQIAPDDPEMLAAVETARRRWPEFVAAFENRPADCDEQYSIKAPFGAGQHAEFMWATVTGIENDVVYGILGNEPADIPGLHEGDRVKTTVSELNDWMYIANDEMVGGFTVKVVMERGRQQSEQNKTEQE